MNNKPKLPGLRLRGDNYYLDKIVKGVRLTECVGPDPDIASAILSKRVSEIWEGTYFAARRKNSLTILEILNSYWEESLKHLTSKNTRKYHLTRLRQEFGNLSVADLNIAGAKNYCRKRLSECRMIRYKIKGAWHEKPGKQISARTVNAELNELMSALNWAVKNLRIDYNPIAALKKIEEREPTKTMLDEGNENGSDWRRLYNAAGLDLKPIINVQYLTGMRIGEVLALRWSWIDITAGGIRLPAYSVKTRRKRNIPISGELRALLLSIPKAIVTDLVFPTQEGKQRRSVKRAFDGAVVRAGWERGYLTTHALRRTRGQIWDRIDRHLSSVALGHDVKIHDRHYTEPKLDMLLSLVGVSDKSPTEHFNIVVSR